MGFDGSNSFAAFVSLAVHEMGDYCAVFKRNTCQHVFRVFVVRLGMLSTYLSGATSSCSGHNRWTIIITMPTFGKAIAQHPSKRTGAGSARSR